MQHPQVRLTGRLQQLLPSFIPSILGLGSTTAVDKVVVDNERHILYAVNQPGTIQVGGWGCALCHCWSVTMCNACMRQLGGLCTGCVHTQ